MSLGTANEEDLARCRAHATGCSRQCGPHLEDPGSIRIASTVEGEVPGYSQRGRGNINARGEGLSLYIRGEGGPYRWPSSCVHGGGKRRGQGRLGRLGNRIA